MTGRQESAQLPVLDPQQITWEWTKNASNEQWEARRKRGAALMEQAYSSNPLFAAKAAQDTDYWLKLYDSQPNW